MSLINQAKIQTYLPDKSNLSTLSTSPNILRFLFLLNKISMVVVIGAVDKWIVLQNGERFRHVIHDNEPEEVLETLWVTCPHRV
jgi:hypothetical protein